MINEKDEWGNISLPGLDDDKLYNKNWNVVSSALERSKKESWKQQQQQAGHRFQPGESWVRDLKHNDPVAYAEWLKHHRLVTKAAGQKESFKENSRKNAQAQWADPAKKQRHKQALRAGWDKPGAREAKSVSAREVANRPEVYAANIKRIQERAIKQQIAIINPDGVWASARAIAEFKNWDRAAVGYRRSKLPTEWFYISPDDYVKCLEDTNHIDHLRALRQQGKYEYKR